MIHSVHCDFNGKVKGSSYTVEHVLGVMYSCDKCKGFFCERHVGTVVGSHEMYCRNCEMVQIVPKPAESPKKRNLLTRIDEINVV